MKQIENFIVLALIVICIVFQAVSVIADDNSSVVSQDKESVKVEILYTNTDGSTGSMFIGSENVMNHKSSINIDNDFQVGQLLSYVLEQEASSKNYLKPDVTLNIALVFTVEEEKYDDPDEIWNFKVDEDGNSVVKRNGKTITEKDIEQYNSEKAKQIAQRMQEKANKIKQKLNKLITQNSLEKNDVVLEALNHSSVTFLHYSHNNIINVILTC